MLNLADYGALVMSERDITPEDLTSAVNSTVLTPNDPGPESLTPLDLPYTVSEVLVAVVAVIGNALTITVFAIDRKLRRLTNYYIVSLALADLLVGVLGIPFAILTAIGLPKPLWACLVMLSTLLMLCTISIFCLVAVSVDRYWAILYPLRYSRVMTAKIARRIIFGCWAAGMLVGLMPVMGWHEEYKDSCIFTEVMNYDYLVFLYLCTIICPGLLMAVFYTHIYTVVLKQLRQIVAQEPQADSASLGVPQGGSQRQRPSFFRTQSRGQVSEGSSTKYDQRRGSTNTNIVHQVTHASKREVKAAKSLSIIVLFFMISWFPLYTINCVQAFCKQCVVHPHLMFFTIILTHLNSAINPFLYAYHMKDFRNALKVFILHRLLRRPVDLDCVYGRSLVSPHHSTLYRVNQTVSTPLTSLHTPHAINSPITGSLSPLPGTPLGELRSQSSTVGSYGPLSTPRNVSPSASFPSSPVIPANTSWRHSTVRPRAATINTHTSPASATTTTDDSSQRLLSSCVTVTAPLQPSQTAATLRATTLPLPSVSHPLGLMVPTLHISTAPQHDTPAVCVADVTPNTNDASEVSTLHSRSTATYNVLQEAASDSTTSGIITTPSVQTGEKTQTGISTQLVPCVSTCPSSVYSAPTGNSPLAKNETQCHTKEEVMGYFPCRKDLNISTSNQTVSAHEKIQGSCRCNENIRSKTSDPMADARRNKKGDEPESTIQPAVHHRDDEIQIREVSWPDDSREASQPTELTPLKIPNGSVWSCPSAPLDAVSSKSQSEEYSSACDASTFPCLGSTIEQNKRGATHDEGLSSREVEDTWHGEQSGLSKELSKYLPKILQRKESGIKSKNSRKNKNWWTEMMRQRSYHGISLEFRSSKHLKRAQSISGAIET